MNINFPHLSYIGRRMGKTTAICKAAKEINAYVVVRSSEEKRRLEKDFGVKCLVYWEDVRGFDGRPCLVDTDAVSYVSDMYDSKISFLQLERNGWQKDCEERDRTILKLKEELRIANQFKPRLEWIRQMYVEYNEGWYISQEFIGGKDKTFIEALDYCLDGKND